MITRRTFLQATSAIAASSTVLLTRTAAAQPIWASPLFRECDYLLLNVRPTAEYNCSVRISKIGGLHGIPIQNVVEAEDRFFRMVPEQEPRLCGYHRIVSMGNRIAAQSRRGFGNRLFANTSTLERLGLARSNTVIGRWSTYRPTASIMSCVASDMGRINIFGTDDALPFGDDLLMVYVGNSAVDGPGVIRVSDKGDRSLVLHPDGSPVQSSSYGSRMRAPLNLVTAANAT